MRKSLIIALVALIVSVVVPAAQADPTLGERIIAQEKAKGDAAATALEARSEALNQQYGLGSVVVQPTGPTAIEQILAQERGRQADAGLFGPSPAAPVLVAGPADAFDIRDAGIGGAAMLALALLVAAAVALRMSRRREPAEAATTG